ncbi:MAG TPA: cyclic pyranopterin monophosphate synthase MoaC [Candidatus Limnocylindria bacterium]|nr:cyclic pyranopterin monophosphate synthase MoaC [Candidatus Limnocylindria bacterium]
MPARKKLTHIDSKGAARMVDVSAKPATDRRATARGLLRLSRETLDLIKEGRTPKGDVRAAARIAGIMAAKRTPDLIPLAHPLPLSHATVELTFARDGIEIEATVGTTAPTGVEMEALTAVTVAGLTLYDMLKSIERGASLTDVRLVAKSGGKSGEYRAP